MALPDIRSVYRPGDLKEASPKYLVRFLSPFADFLKSKGLVLHETGNDERPLDYRKLSSILMASDPAMPRELVDSLHCVREMATPEMMDVLLDEAKAHDISIDDDVDLTPIDVALQIWVQDCRIIERKHAEQFLIKPCTFVYYQAGKPADTEFFELSPDAIKALERDLDLWFQSRKRGRGCRVFCYPHEDGIWFMVWHGAPFKREGCIEHGEPSCICYRPERHDVLVFQPATCELQIDTDTKCERDVYRKLFGRHLFGDDHHFPGTAIYSLEPLRADKEKSLTCSDIPGIEWIRLRKIEFCWGSHIRRIETFEADDVFSAIHSGEVRIPSSARITEAWFKIRFSDSKMPRTVSIRPSNIIHYQRDSDCEVVERWLRKRCFFPLNYLLLVLAFPYMFQLFQGMDSFLPGLA